MTVRSRIKARPLFDGPIVRQAVLDSFRKLNPRHQVRNPVMFVVLVGSVLTTLLAIQANSGQGRSGAWVYLGDFDLALVYGALRQLCRSDGRRAWQGAGRFPAQSQA